MRLFATVLIGLAALTGTASDAFAQRRVTTNNTYGTNNYNTGYANRGGYYGYGCGNCWVGPTVFFGTAMIAGALMAPRTVIVPAPSTPVYIMERTPVPGRPDPMRPIGEVYIDPQLNRVCRDFETEVRNREGFHDRVVRKFCEVEAGKRYVEVRANVPGPVPLH